MAKVKFAAGAATEIGSDRGYDVYVDVPDGYSYKGRVAPTLLYPVEVAAIANWDLPVNDGDAGTPEAWPRVDLMPRAGVLLWILQGDVGYDYKAMPAQGDWFAPGAYSYLGAANQSATPSERGANVVGRERAMSGADRFDSPWTGSNLWARLIPLTGPNGETQDHPPYLMVYQFSGVGEAPVRDADSMLSSMEVVYREP